jgi:hypothetical protein
MKEYKFKVRHAVNYSKEFTHTAASKQEALAMVQEEISRESISTRNNTFTNTETDILEVGNLGVKTTFAQVNKALINSLYELFNAHISNGGTLDYSERQYSQISNELDEIEVGYLGNAADGSYQNELEKTEFKMSAEECFNTIVSRLNDSEFKEIQDEGEYKIRFISGNKAYNRQITAKDIDEALTKFKALYNHDTVLSIKLI